MNLHCWKATDGYATETRVQTGAAERHPQFQADPDPRCLSRVRARLYRPGSYRVVPVNVWRIAQGNSQNWGGRFWWDQLEIEDSSGERMSRGNLRRMQPIQISQAHDADMRKMQLQNQLSELRPLVPAQGRCNDKRRNPVLDSLHGNTSTGNGILQGPRKELT